MWGEVIVKLGGEQGKDTIGKETQKREEKS